MIMKTRMYIIPLITALLFAANLTSAQEYERTVRKTFDVVSAPVVTIESRFGPVSVKSHKASTVNVKVKIVASDESKAEAKEIAEAVDVEISGTKDRVSVETSFPDHLGGGEDRSIEIQIAVLVPAKTKLSVENKFGSVKVKYISGSVEIENSFGSIEVRNSSNINVESSYGSISLGSISGFCEVETKMGDLQAYDIQKGNFENAYGETEIQKASGFVTIDSKMGSVTARNIRGANITNSYGNVEVTLTSAFSGSIKASSSFGSIDTDLPLKSEKKKSYGPTAEKVYGKIGSGKDKLVIETSFGSIEIGKK